MNYEKLHSSLQERIYVFDKLRVVNGMENDIKICKN